MQPPCFSGLTTGIHQAPTRPRTKMAKYRSKSLQPWCGSDVAPGRPGPWLSGSREVIKHQHVSTVAASQWNNVNVSRIYTMPHSNCARCWTTRQPWPGHLSRISHIRPTQLHVSEQLKPRCTEMAQPGQSELCQGKNRST